MPRAKSPKYRRLTIESLETRRVLASLPFGAEAADTGEYMLGRIAVTPVFLESDGSIDPNSENWTQSAINDVMAKIDEAFQWWSDLLATKTSVHTLEWIVDRTYVDNPVPTPYEPISRVSNAYAQWVPHFLGTVGFSSSPSLEANIRAFNNEQRLKHDSDWSFTIFVVNSQNDSDGNFAAGGSFSRAFAFAGGLFQVIPSTRPASTFAHETGHMFWARDEYAGSGNYNQQRGYYNAQNTNAIDSNPNVGFVQEPSIMSSGITLDLAWYNLVTSDATLAQIGWRDSDGDGIFDVLDVPLALEGTGRIDDTGLFYNFTGSASVQTYPNTNSFGTQNDITLNRVDQVEYRLDDGEWIVLSTPETSVAQLNLRIPISATNTQIQIRARDTRTGIESNLFSDSIDAAPNRTIDSGIYGFAWLDRDQDNRWDVNETTIPNASVTLVDAQGLPLQLQTRLAISDFPAGPITQPLKGVLLEAIGFETDGRLNVVYPSNGGSPYLRTYSYTGAAVESFAGENYQLKASFQTPQREASIDAIASINNSNVRFEAFDAQGNLIERVEARGLAIGERATLSVGSASANIAYVVARAFGNSSSRFENITYGSSSTTKTNSDGSFSFPYLAPGSYRIEVRPANVNMTPSVGDSFVQIVTLASSPQVARQDFAFYVAPSPWQNPVRPEDIDGDGSVTPLDALHVINTINTTGSRSLTAADLERNLFLDSDGDGYLSPLDALIVINYINTYGVGSLTGTTSPNSQQAHGEGSSSLETTSLVEPYSESATTGNAEPQNIGYNKTPDQEQSDALPHLLSQLSSQSQPDDEIESPLNREFGPDANPILVTSQANADINLTSNIVLPPKEDFEQRLMSDSLSETNADEDETRIAPVVFDRALASQIYADYSRNQLAWDQASVDQPQPYWATDTTDSNESSEDEGDISDTIAQVARWSLRSFIGR